MGPLYRKCSITSRYHKLFGAQFAAQLSERLANCQTAFEWHPHAFGHGITGEFSGLVISSVGAGPKFELQGLESKRQLSRVQT